MEQVLGIVNEHGIKGVEVWAEQVWYYNSTVRDIVHAKEKHGMSLTCHAASWDLNIAALNKGIRVQSVEEIKKSILLAEQMHAGNITIHPGRRTMSKEWTNWHVKVLIESLNEIAVFAQQHHVVVSIEVMEHVKKELITDYAAINSLLDYLPDSVMTTLDIAHIPSEEDFAIYYSQIKRINKIHISDRIKKKYHVPLGQGELDCVNMLKVLYHSELPLVIEGFDDSKKQKVLQENLNFLRQHFENYKKRSG
ncbi:sugar phosphate isomerase/epimerase family protein [Petroclostridium sp. X23]|uniref:sugar phosphate isomerase/epimerase family protein n=1 Tax=Petroclostridium sp. X23 TaxID=3045146 RepID=UPI0024AE647C|nr:sugar phosphate isomerase/epimerase family protein [Petroclostridium sp. X23]WHH58756.1 sugar phosphate isomerase/epimerase family protein [Petroclostridium sp. X23]